MDVQPNGLLLFGYGDGGGGPNETHIHNLRRARAAHNNGYTDIPKVQFSDTVQDFYDEVLRVTDGGKRLPTWQGDLYLEFHRGVYTSHGSIKRWNRKLEIKLHNVEWAATLASLSGRSYKYPKKALDELWEGLLFNQFHDILPGSSIRMVYEDAEKDYAAIDKKADRLLAAAQEILFAPVHGAQAPLAKETPQCLVTALNTLAIPRSELVAVPVAWVPFLSSENGTQIVSTLGGPHALVPMRCGDISAAAHDLDSIDGLSRVLRDVQSLGPACAFYDAATKSYVLSNHRIKLVVKGGRIASLYDLEQNRELLRKGQTAGLTIAEDYPPSWDAWETEVYSLDTEESIVFDSVSVHEEEKGPLRASLVGKATFGKSKVLVKMSLDGNWAGSDSRSSTPVVFDFKVDWAEKHRFLRFTVPTNLVADKAAYETQFGITYRPTGRNTSWDAAKFEVCAHRFADLSEANYGVAILSESKYGFSVEGGTMRASLLKAGTYPDAHQDEGKHAFSLALLPHTGPGEDPGSGVLDAARAFNNPLLPVQKARGIDVLANQLGLHITSQSGTVVLDTIKRGEADFDYHQTRASGKTTVVARLYEAAGAHTKAELLVAGIKTVKATSASILEDHQGGLSSSDGKTAFSLRPFEVKTIVLEVA